MSNPLNIISCLLIKCLEVLPRSWQGPLFWDRLNRKGKTFSYWARCADYWEVKRGRKAGMKLMVEHKKVLKTLDDAANRLQFELEKLEKRHD